MKRIFLSNLRLMCAGTSGSVAWILLVFGDEYFPVLHAPDAVRFTCKYNVYFISMTIAKGVMCIQMVRVESSNNSLFHHVSLLQALR